MLTERVIDANCDSNDYSPSLPSMRVTIVSVTAIEVAVAEIVNEP